MTNEGKGAGKDLQSGIFTRAEVVLMLALLYAPKSGKEFREDIKSESLDLTEDAEK